MKTCISPLPGRRGILRLLPCAALAFALVPAPLAAQVQINGGSAALPLRCLAERADFHLMVYFDGHPEYEAVEAFIRGTGPSAGAPAIRAILSRHDGSQVDYLGSAAESAAGPGTDPVRLDTGNGRVSWRVPMTLQGGGTQRDWQLSFPLADRQTLTMAYLGGSKPNPAYGGLTDPGRHAGDSALPYLYRETSGMGSGKSFVRIGAVKYPVTKDPEASKPPFFYAHKAYLSLGFQSLILSACQVRAELAPVGPPLAASGESAELPRLVFSPPLPDARTVEPGQAFECRFSLVAARGTEAEGGKPALAGGSLRLERLADTSALVRLRPDSPAWSRQRPMLYRLDWADGSLNIDASLDKP